MSRSFAPGISLETKSLSLIEEKIDLLMKENDGLPTEGRKFYEEILKEWRENIMKQPSGEEVIIDINIDMYKYSYRCRYMY